ncbi:hypothetical protein CCP3SC1AL1_2350002 [Gammaproteobacteria bacterium]
MHGITKKSAPANFNEFALLTIAGTGSSLLNKNARVRLGIFGLLSIIT